MKRFSNTYKPVSILRLKFLALLTVSSVYCTSGLPNRDALSLLLTGEITQSAIRTNSGNLSPAFDANISEYTLDLRFQNTNIGVAVDTDLGAIKINGQDALTGEFNIESLPILGNNTITVEFQPNGEEQTRQYTIHAIRNLPEPDSSASTLNADATDSFGQGLALDGDTLVVGAGYEDSNATTINGDSSNNSAPDRGAAYVFVRENGAWVQEAYLKSPVAAINQYFGYSVAISGDTIAVGAFNEGLNGVVYIFTRSAGVWTQQAKLEPQGAGADLDWFGQDLDLSGDSIIVGAFLEDSASTGVNGSETDNSSIDSGAAYIFVRNSGVWTQQAYLKASDTGDNDNFGKAVALDGDLAVVGSPGDLLDSGAMYVFVRNNGVWTQEDKNVASDIDPGDEFGFAVDIYGETIIVGNPRNSNGAAHVFTRNNGNWTEQEKFTPSNPGPATRFGIRVAIHGDTILIGCDGEASNASSINGDQSDTSAPNAGSAYLFTRIGNTWTQEVYLKSQDNSSGDYFGLAVALTSDYIVVGAPHEAGSGKVYTFR